MSDYYAGQADTPRTFYWFDFETFGADARRDRPAQFAGIRTDENLNILESDVFYCQLADDYLPNPEACMITGITPMTCMDTGMPEAEFAAKIYEKFSVPGTVGVGYNNFGFDDELMRFMFWRNLIDPYAREWGQKRARFDIYNLVRIVYAFKPQTLKWPLREDGSFSMRLEHLTAENGLSHEHAHDALSDVKATIALAKLIKERQPRLWEYTLKLTDKKFGREMLECGQPLLYMNPFAGQKMRYLSLIYPLQENPNRKNEWYCWDLTHDPKEIESISSKDLARMYLTREQRDSGIEPLPIISVRLTNQPFLVKAAGYMGPGAEKGFGIKKDEMFARAGWIQNTDLSKINSLWAEKADQLSEKMQEDASEIETSLYSGGFASDRDRATMERLRRMTAEDLAGVAGGIEFDNERFGDMLLHYRARNFPETIDDAADEEKWRAYREDHLVGGKNRSMNFERYFAMLEKLQEERPDREEVIEELFEYGENLASEFQ